MEKACVFNLIQVGELVNKIDVDFKEFHSCIPWEKLYGLRKRKENMATAKLEERVDVMTDFQMRTLMNLIIEIVRQVDKKEDVIEKLVAIRDGKTDDVSGKSKSDS